MKGLFGLLRDLRWHYVLRWVYGVRSGTVLGDERVTGYLMLPYVFMLWGYGDVETEGRRDGEGGGALERCRQTFVHTLHTLSTYGNAGRRAGRRYVTIAERRRREKGKKKKGTASVV